jgi:gamma-glutamylcyclotransferase (GGCT)/AIG2-like uncharacterized protein YtfP
VAGVSLFVYGTLTSEARLRSLTGRRFRRQRARLEGFVRIAPPRGHPYVVPRAGARVEGYLVHGVDERSLRKLDAYEEEGRLYHRRRVVAIANAHRVSCQVYVGDVDALTQASRRRFRP